MEIVSLDLITSSNLEEKLQKEKSSCACSCRCGGSCGTAKSISAEELPVNLSDYNLAVNSYNTSNYSKK
ncbi:MAG: hypothetical protein WC393_00420 [Candidatus Nanoarchaeia archaeon]|jgi:hypothetical protein